jgi:hypothetical protein
MNRGAIIFELAFLILLSFGFVTTPGKSYSLAFEAEHLALRDYA